MVLRIVIVGPGRVGLAFARQLQQPGVRLLGCVARTAAPSAATVAAVAAAATGLVAPSVASTAHVVVFAVGDQDLAAAIAALAAAAPPRPCALWLHTSGRHGLEVFASLAPGCRRGALHPVAPFADPVRGQLALRGAPGVYDGEPRSEHLLRVLAQRLGLVPVRWPGGDKVLYHAACALAANGACALFADAVAAFASAAPWPSGAAAQLTTALMQAALAASRDPGAVAALSGPVRRGDAATVAAHRAQLQRAAPAVEPAYLVLMQRALALARAAGLPEALASQVAAALRR